MEQVTDRSIRDQCRAAMLLYISGCTSPVDTRNLAPIYHGFYTMRNGAPRWQNLSSFLSRMESDGLIRCTYRRDGLVSSVESKSANAPEEEVTT